MGKMIYVPDALLPDLEVLKRALRQGKCYDIICYDSKEETEEKESFPPHPLYKEREEKEERETTTSTTKKKKNPKKMLFFIPSFAEVKDYFEEIGAFGFEPQEFYDYYQSYGWKSRDGNKVADWKALMRQWLNKRKLERKDEKMKTINQQDNALLRKGKRTVTAAQGAGATRGQAVDGDTELDERASLLAWMYAELPLLGDDEDSGKGAAEGHEGDGNGAAQARKKAIDSYMQRYRVERQGDWADESVFERTQGWLTLAQSTQQVGVNAVVRVVMMHLHSLAEDMGSTKSSRKPKPLHRMAMELCRTYPYLKMPEVVLALNLFRRRRIDVFHGRLNTSNLMKGMEEFMKWRGGVSRELSLR